MDHRVTNYVQDSFSFAGTGAGGDDLQFCCRTYCTYFVYLLGLIHYVLDGKRKGARVYADFGKWYRCQHDVNCPPDVAY
jgi:hypothetical protein